MGKEEQEDGIICLGINLMLLGCWLICHISQEVCVGTKMEADNSKLF